MPARAECGREFEPRSGKQRYCQDACRYRRRDRLDYERDPDGERAKYRDNYSRNRDAVLERRRHPDVLAQRQRYRPAD